MVPLHEAIASSFQSSIAKLYGWEAEWFEARTRLSPGHALLVRSGAVIDFADEWTCTVAVEKGPPLDTLFATAGRALRGNGTMVLLGGDDPAGVDGLAAAQLAGAQCYLQDPKTALFCSWPPLLPAGIPQLDLEAVAAGVRVAMADAGSSGA